MHGLRTIEKLNAEHQQAVTILTRQVIEKDNQIQNLKDEVALLKKLVSNNSIEANPVKG